MGFINAYPKYEELIAIADQIHKRFQVAYARWGLMVIPPLEINTLNGSRFWRYTK